jgi:hypothetical protein
MASVAMATERIRRRTTCVEIRAEHNWAMEFSFGSLKRVKKLSKEWLRVGDEPMSPYTVEWELDEEGDR